MRNLFHRSCIICWKKKDIILSHNCILLKISLHNFLNTFSPCKHAGFILEHSLAGFPQFGKKCPQKFTSPHQMGHKNYRPKGKFFFLEKKSLTQSHHWFDGRSINFLWTFITSYCLNCLSLLCLGHYFTRQTFWILQSFEPRLFHLPRMFQNRGKKSISVCFLMKQSVPISSNTFCGTPFLKKGPLKITEQGPLDPHWPISRINPERVYTNWEHIQKNWDDWTQNILSSHVTVLTKRVKKTKIRVKGFKRFVDHLQEV